MLFESKCPLCGTGFQAEEDWIGQIGECPSCGKEITIQSEDMQEVVETPKTIQITLKNKPVFRQKQPTAKQEAIPPKDIAQAEPNSETENCKDGEKICPFCGETIKAVAVKCRFCQSDLADKDKKKTQKVEPVVSQYARQGQNPTKSHHNVDNRSSFIPNSARNIQKKTHGKRYYVLIIIGLVILAFILIGILCMISGDQSSSLNIIKLILMLIVLSILVPLAIIGLKIAGMSQSVAYDKLCRTAYCPYCEEGFYLQDSLMIGKVIQCSSCRKDFTLSITDVSNKKALNALLLYIFFGGICAHKFYADRTGEAITLLLIGFLGGVIWVVGLNVQGGWAGLGILMVIIYSITLMIDFIMILMGVFKDGKGKYISKWT